MLLVKLPLPHKGAVTCAVCPESAWLVTFLIGNVSTGVVTWSALRCGASGESGKKVAAAPLSKTAAAAAAAKTWFAKHSVDYMLHNRFPWKRSGRRSSMWPPYSLRRNLSAAACRPCDRSFIQVLCLLMSGPLTLAGHQTKRYGLYRGNESFSSIRTYSNYLCHIRTEKDR